MPTLTVQVTLNYFALSQINRDKRASHESDLIKALLGFFPSFLAFIFLSQFV